MKVLSIVVVATMVLAVTDAQFSLSTIFSGLRQRFSRPRTRVRPRQRPQTIFVPAGQFLSQSEQSNFIPQASPSTSFLPVGQEVFQPRLPPALEQRPPPISRPATLLRTTQPSFSLSSPRPTQQVPSQSQTFIQRPQSPSRPLNNNGREFGAPKPESVISTSAPLQQSSPPVQISSNKNSIQEQSSQISSSQHGESSNFKVTEGNQNIQVVSFPKPLPQQNDNNIIGMLPPPLPSSTITTTSTTTTTGAVIVTLPSSTTTTTTGTTITGPSTTAGSVIVTQPPLFSLSSSSSPLTTLSSQARENPPQSDSIVTLDPETNSGDPPSLSQNPVPTLNAGVLPLADISKEPQFFPPFNQISVESFNTEREQRELFPPFGFKDEVN